MLRSIMAASAALLTASALAQTATPPGLAAAPTPAGSTQSPQPQPQPAISGVPVQAIMRPAPSSVLPANTDLMLRLDREINSKKIKQGETFPLSVASDVMLGNYIVIPRGTPATGEVTYRTGKGAFGKSAKMEIDMRSLDLNGRRIPLQGHFREEGGGNTGATVGTAVAAGPFAAFVTGRSAIFKQDREFRAQTREAIPVAIPQ